MREFVAAGGEMIIHAALLSKNTAPPELISHEMTRMFTNYIDSHP